jgi:hypothetical protein
MKKTFLLFITFYCLLFTSRAQSFYEMDKPNLEGFGLKGKVLSFKDTEYKAMDSSGLIKRGVKQYIIVFLFNKMGYMIEMNQYFPDGRLNAKNSYQYDAKGNYEESLYDEKGKLLSKSKVTYKYDSTGNIIELLYQASDRFYNGKSTYKYDAKGNKIEFNQFNAKDSLESKDNFKYDANGIMIERDFCNPKGSLIYKNIYINDTNGNMIEWDLYKADGSLKTKRTYKYDYDATGNWIKKTEIRNDVPQKITERKIKYY